MKKWFLVILAFILVLSFYPSNTKAYGECSQYGIWATYDYSGSCQCMSGYVFGKDVLGQTSCISGDTLCHDKYGYNSRYDSFENSCECSYGYIFGKDSIGRTQCVSPESICTDQLGYNARYNTLSDRCECRSGYVIEGGMCRDADLICHSNHGYNSSYDDLSNSCECDSGYTLNDSSQCVEKQNNVYFTLKELDTDEKKAIIKSDYDYRYYLISYNSGCYSSSFRRYLNRKIVVNLGTDFYVDTWDKIVLQDDNETCDITRKEYADSSTTLIPEEEEEVYYYVPKPVVASPAPVVKTPEIPKQVQTTVIKAKPELPKVDVSKIILLDKEIDAKLKAAGTLRKCPSTNCEVIRYYAETASVKVIGNYNNKEWFKIRAKNDNGNNIEGWMHNSVLETIIDTSSSAGVQSTTTKATVDDGSNSWVKRLWKFVFGAKKK